MRPTAGHTTKRWSVRKAMRSTVKRKGLLGRPQFTPAQQRQLHLAAQHGRRLGKRHGRKIGFALGALSGLAAYGIGRKIHFNRRIMSHMRKRAPYIR